MKTQKKQLFALFAIVALLPTVCLGGWFEDDEAEEAGDEENEETHEDEYGDSNPLTTAARRINISATLAPPPAPSGGGGGAGRPEVNGESISPRGARARAAVGDSSQPKKDGQDDVAGADGKQQDGDSASGAATQKPERLMSPAPGGNDDGRPIQPRSGDNNPAAGSASASAGPTDPATERIQLKLTLEDYFSSPRHYVSNSAAHSRAKDYVKGQLEIAKAEIISQEFESYLNYPVGQNTSVTGMNILGIVKGVHWGTSSDKIYVVGAHYDTTPESDGVDSNGSGVVAMLALAKRLRGRSEQQQSCQLQHSCIFATFDLQLREHEPSSIGLTGSQAFVRNYLGPLLRSKEKGTLGGAIILDSIMNWNDSKNTQYLGQGFHELFPEAFELIQKSDYRGNFITLVSEKNKASDQALAAEIAQFWQRQSEGGGAVDDSTGKPQSIRAPMRMATIDATKTTSTAATETLLHFIRRDHTSFWNYYPTPQEHMHLPAVLLTNTGYWRNKPSACRTNSWSCNTGEFITDEKLLFLQKTIDTVDAFLWQGECKPTEGDGNSGVTSQGAAHLVFGALSVVVARFLLS